jgi:ribosomal protein S18 acetylase RimI-like enzyme
MAATEITRYLGATPPNLDVMLEASRTEGHRLVERTLDDWTNATNRFDRPGEALFVAVENGESVGMCGLNVDPFAGDPTVGRLRHLYVLPWLRRRGIGRRLVVACLTQSGNTFERVRVRTSDSGASEFYEALGFEPTDEADASHTRAQHR